MKSLGNIMIFGDSYSTLQDYIPSEYKYYYGKDRADTLALGVTEFSQTWWGQLILATSSTLLKNDSYSGSTVCNTCREELGVTTSFINRLDKYIERGFFKENRVDTLFLFGGTNDFWIDAPWGKITNGNFTKEDLLSFAPALEYFLSRVQENSPSTRIITLVNTGFAEEFNLLIKTACHNAGVEILFLQNIEKENGHPNTTGMTQIAKQIFDYLTANEK